MRSSTDQPAPVDGRCSLPPLIRLESRDVIGTLFPVDFELQVSTDNVSYTTIYSETDFSSAAGTWYGFEGFAPVVARYVRLWVTESGLYSGQYWVQLAELEVSEAVPVVGQARLEWTATGDDGSNGTATSYDIRYSIAAITTDTEFDAATPVSSPPTPSASGTAESFTVAGLGSGTYHFALKTSDEVDNVSSLSNDAEVTLP
jgi:hypothetical protein